MTDQIQTNEAAAPVKHIPARQAFNRSGHYYTMPFADILKVILAKDATEGPMTEIPNRELEPEHANNLAELIRENGYNEESWPRMVYHNNKLYAYIGNHRVAALQKLASEGFDKIENVKFTIVDMKAMSPEDHAISLWTSNLQKGLGMPDQAKVVHTLYRISKDKARIAKQLNITVQTVDNMLEYNNLVPAEVKQMVEEGKIMPTTALQVFREEGRDDKATVKRLEDAFEVLIAENAAKVASKKGKAAEKEAAKPKKITEKHLKATRKTATIPDEFAGLAKGFSSIELLSHIADLTEVAQRALKFLAKLSDEGNEEADEVSFEVRQVLDVGLKQGFVKAPEIAKEEEAFEADAVDPIYETEAVDDEFNQEEFPDETEAAE